MEEEAIFEVPFGKEEIQSFAENNFGEKLDDLELNRIKSYWWDDEKVFAAKMDLLFAAIEMALNEETDWTEVDREYIKSQQS